MFKAKQTRAAARAALKGKYWWAVLAVIITGLFGAISFTSSSSYSRISTVFEKQAENAANSFPPFVYVILLVLSMFLVLVGIALLVLSSAVNLGYKRFNMALYLDEEHPTMGILFSRLKITGKAFWFSILVALKVFAWSLLFVVPGIIAGYRYAMAPFILAENPEMKAIDAIRKSTEMMKGNKGRLFCMKFSFIGWAILAALVPFGGPIFLRPYTEAADAAFYLNLTGRLGEKAEN